MKNKNETAYQLLTEGRYGDPVLQVWSTDKEEAEKSKAECEKFWPEEVWWIEQGTHHINEKCRGCETIHCEEMSDAYGISTGFWCGDCYDSNKYPYRKDNYYDPAYAGERMEPEDY